MKRLKKVLLMLLCVGTMVSATACAGNADDNGADQNKTIDQTGENHTVNDDEKDIGKDIEHAVDPDQK